MAIEIIENIFQDNEGGDTFWASWLEITDGFDTFLFPATAPGTLAEIDLQAHYDAKEAQLFADAQIKGIGPDDLYTATATKRVLKAFILVTLDEINILRTAAAMAPRTAAQLRTAVKNKLQTL